MYKPLRRILSIFHSDSFPQYDRISFSRRNSSKNIKKNVPLRIIYSLCTKYEINLLNDDGTVLQFIAWQCVYNIKYILYTDLYTYIYILYYRYTVEAVFGLFFFLLLPLAVYKRSSPTFGNGLFIYFFIIIIADAFFFTAFSK